MSARQNSFSGGVGLKKQRDARHDRKLAPRPSNKTVSTNISSGSALRRSNYSQRQRRRFASAQQQDSNSLSAEQRASLSAEEAIPVNVSFGNFDFHEFHNAQQRGGGVRELSSLLRASRRQKRLDEDRLTTRGGAAERRGDLLKTAMMRLRGEKVKDDPSKLSKALAKRRQRKRQSAKKWAKRIDALHQSVEMAGSERARHSGSGKERKGKKEQSKLGKQKMKGGKQKVGSKASSTRQGSASKRAGGGKQQRQGGRKH